MHKNSKSVFETSIISARITQEQKRQLLINECLQRAAWAGDDLRKWNVIDETNKNCPEKREIMENRMALAHAEFLSILEEVQDLTKIYERCKNDPFLLREYALAREEIQEILNNIENSEDDIKVEYEEPEEFENYDDTQIESDDVEPEEFEDDEKPEFRMPRP